MDIRNINTAPPIQSSSKDVNRNFQLPSLSQIANVEITFNKLDQKIKFYENIDLLLSSGLDINNALVVISNQKNSKWIGGVSRMISKSLNEGNDLAVSMGNAKGFKPFEIAIIKVGEESGKLEKVVSLLTDYFRRSKKIKRIILSSISYPLFVLFVSFGVIVFMLNNVVPMFDSIFSRFGGELPRLTKIIVYISDVLRNNLGLIFLSIISLTGAVIYLLKNESYRLFIEKLILRIPMIGEVYQRNVTLRFFEMMALQMNSKISLEKALLLTANTSNSVFLKKSLKKGINNYLNGASLVSVLRETHFFKIDQLSIIEIGEANNRLNTVFDSVAKKLREDGEYFTGQISAVLEPFLIIFVGFIIGLVLIALYLPIFKMSTTMEF